MVVNLSRIGAIAVVTIDNPPVNALGLDVRKGLLDALETTEADTAVSSVVLTCAGRTFIAGADIREFGKPPVEPHLPDLLARIERATKPWVAAIHGTALGGGLETALVCSHRIAARDAKLGLPEVNLGLIPGAGGTVRLPRVVAAEKALEMISGGKPVAAMAALEMGLIDAIADGDLREAAIALAEKAAGDASRLPLSERPPIAATDEMQFEAMIAKIEKRAGQQNAPKAAIASVRNALSMSAGDAFAAEREAFIALRADPQSAALRHIFFAERGTARSDRIKNVTPMSLEDVGVVGGGTMGAGIAAACLLSGFKVIMVERDAKAADAGRSRVEAILDGSRKRGLISEDAHAGLLERFAAADRYEALAASDLIIEAVFEEMAVKKQVFERLDEVAKPDAILASNTSYLDVNEIAAKTRNPTRIVGLHFFSPAHIMKLLEIVVPDTLDDRVLATSVAFAKRLRKIAVLSGVCDGFIANRIMSAYRAEAEYMLEDGALPWQIDRAMTDFGLPMGVFSMQDLAGLDIGWARRKRQAPTRDPNERYVEIADRLCEQGRFGRKTGRGYYLYDEAGKASPDPEIEALIVAESARKGIQREAMNDDMIMQRVLGAMVAEANRVLDEGIAANPDDIDVVMVNAFGFPRWRGGPMFMARQDETAKG